MTIQEETLVPLDLSDAITMIYRQKKQIAALEKKVDEFDKEICRWASRAKVAEKQIATLIVENDRLRGALGYIAIYWNGNENLRATTDAANMARDTAEAALRGKEEENEIN